jgi:hypothetical protein
MMMKSRSMPENRSLPLPTPIGNASRINYYAHV